MDRIVLAISPKVLVTKFVLAKLILLFPEVIHVELPNRFKNIPKPQKTRIIAMLEVVG